MGGEFYVQPEISAIAYLKIMKLQHVFFVAVASLALSGCATETASTTTAETDLTRKRVHTQEEMLKTGESDTGAALEKVDASVRISGRR